MARHSMDSNKHVQTVNHVGKRPPRPTRGSNGHGKQRGIRAVTRNKMWRSAHNDTNRRRGEQRYMQNLHSNKTMRDKMARTGEDPKRTGPTTLNQAQGTRHRHNVTNHTMARKGKHHTHPEPTQIKKCTMNRTAPIKNKKEHNNNNSL